MRRQAKYWCSAPAPVDSLTTCTCGRRPRSPRRSTSIRCSLIVAERVTRGDSLELYEFPLAPRGDAALLRTLSAPVAARPGLIHLLADAHRPPFRRGVFDTVVTPWLIDILPERFDLLCARVNALLDDGGRWLNFGSLNFHDADPAARYGLDECLAALEENGFGDVIVEEREIPYLSSPASRHARRERVVTWLRASSATSRRYRATRRCPSGSSEEPSPYRSATPSAAKPRQRAFTPFS